MTYTTCPVCHQYPVGVISTGGNKGQLRLHVKPGSTETTTETLCSNIMPAHN